MQLSVIKVKPCTSYTKKSTIMIALELLVLERQVRFGFRGWSSSSSNNTTTNTNNNASPSIVSVIFCLPYVFQNCNSMKLCEYCGIQNLLVGLNENVIFGKTDIYSISFICLGWFFHVSLVSFVWRNGKHPGLPHLGRSKLRKSSHRKWP